MINQIKIFLIILATISTLLTSFFVVAKYKNSKIHYAHKLCPLPEYECIKVKAGDSWKKLWPKAETRDLIKRINRRNMRLVPGMILAVPRNLENVSIWDVSPFPRYISIQGRKLIVVDQNKLAWGAFNEQGELQWWGPISSGKNYCPDVRRNCQTITGGFQVFNKKGSDCISNVFPVEDGGGAKMPYCMFFYRGYALHGSSEVPGYRDSHGCVRIFKKDAKWLNQNFIETPSEANNHQGTRVIVQELIEE